MRIATLFVITFLSAAAYAQTATQDVTIVVPEVEALSVTAASVTLEFDPPASGGGAGWVDKTVSGGTYGVTANTSSNKITAELDLEFAPGLSLFVSLGSPTGASTSGAQQLSTTPVDLVTDVTGVDEVGLPISYTVSNDGNAAPNAAGETRTVTFTLTDQ